MMELLTAVAIVSLILPTKIPTAASADVFWITSLKTTSPVSPFSASQRSSITFEVHDPKPTAEATTICGASWHRTFGGHPPVRWVSPPTDWSFCAKQQHTTYPISGSGQKVLGASSTYIDSESMPEFQWRIGFGNILHEDGTVHDFQNATNFAFSIVHSYRHPSIGQAPYDGRKTFGKLAVDQSSLDCRTDSLGSLICELKKGVELAMPIYGIV